VEKLDVPFSAPGPSSKLRFFPTTGGKAPLTRGVEAALASECSRLGAGVEKKLDALRFCCEGVWDCGAPFCCCEVGGEGSLSTTKLVQPESMWLLISDDLTGLLQMGQSTAMVHWLRFETQDALYCGMFLCLSAMLQLFVTPHAGNNF
jgi:hypothetical protein